MPHEEANDDRLKFDEMSSMPFENARSAVAIW